MMKDPQQPVVVFRAGSEPEAAIVAAALEANGIRVTVTGEFISSFRAEAPSDVAVVVARADHEEARRVLEQLRASGAAIDWSRQDVGDEP